MSKHWSFERVAANPHNAIHRKLGCRRRRRRRLLLYAFSSRGVLHLQRWHRCQTFPPMKTTGKKHEWTWRRTENNSLNVLTPETWVGGWISLKILLERWLWLNFDDFAWTAKSVELILSPSANSKFSFLLPKLSPLPFILRQERWRRQNQLYISHRFCRETIWSCPISVGGKLRVFNLILTTISLPIIRVKCIIRRQVRNRKGTNLSNFVFVFWPRPCCQGGTKTSHSWLSLSKRILKKRVTQNLTCLGHLGENLCLIGHLFTTIWTSTRHSIKQLRTEFSGVCHFRTS